MNNVERLRKPEADKVPEFDLAVRMAMSGDREITIRCPVTEHISIEEANSRADMVIQIIERQRSKYEIRFAEAQIRDKRKALKLWELRRDEAVAEHQKKQDEREKELARLLEKQEAINIRVARSWSESGRQGEPVRRGADKSSFDLLGRSIDALREEITKQGAEHDQNVRTAVDNVTKLTEEIAALERIVEEHKAIVDA